MPGKRVIGVGVWSDTVCGNVLWTTWRRADGSFGQSSRLEVSAEVACKAARRMHSLHRGSFIPFLGGAVGWTWTP